jgi:hypothetical protein
LNVWIDDAGFLRIGPSCELTDADRDVIRRYRNELMTLIQYCETLTGRRPLTK